MIAKTFTPENGGKVFVITRRGRYAARALRGAGATRRGHGRGAGGNVSGQWCDGVYGDVHAGPAGTVLARGEHQVPRGVHARGVPRIRRRRARAGIPGRGQLGDGRRDAARVRAMPHEEAMADLKKLPGIGDFSAGLILLRGASDPDAVPGQEPRLARAVAFAYGLPGRPRPSNCSRSARTGSPTAPGSRCSCGRSWNSRPVRSPAGARTRRRVRLGLARGCV